MEFGKRHAQQTQRTSARATTCYGLNITDLLRGTEKLVYTPSGFWPNTSVGNQKGSPVRSPTVDNRVRAAAEAISR